MCALNQVKCKCTASPHVVASLNPEHSLSQAMHADRHQSGPPPSKKPHDLVLYIGTRSSFHDVALLILVRESKAASSNEGNAPVPPNTIVTMTSSGRKRKDKDGSAKDETEVAMKYRV